MARDTVRSHPPDEVINAACLPWQAPIGHRQPGAADLPGDFTPTLSDPELQAVNKAIDRRVTICRGC
jgi:hypothetical protein